MDHMRQQIAMRLGVSYHDISTYCLDVHCFNRIDSKLTVTLVEHSLGMQSKIFKLKTTLQNDPSITSVTVNDHYGSSSLNISLEMTLLVGDKFTMLLARALHKTYRESHEWYKSRNKRRKQPTIGKQ